MKKYTVGVDVGGTNIKFGIVNSSGKIIARSRLVTKTISSNKMKLINALVGSIKALIQQKNIKLREIAGIGLGLPGLIDQKAGIVNSLPNIPGWRNVRLKTLIQQKLRVPVFVDNDVNLITLGEWRHGAGKGYRNLICITLGTGVGGGLILNNQLYRGEAYVAGEIGHMPLNEKGARCTCGGFGCFETLIGNARLRSRASKLFKKKNMQIEDVRALADTNNARALKFWEETATHIGNGLVGVTNLLNPKLIIIGGGVSNNYKYLGRTIRRVIKQRAMKVQGRVAGVVRAELGDDAGVIGAQVLVKESLVER